MTIRDMTIRGFIILGILAALVGVGAIEGLRWHDGYALPRTAAFVLDTIWVVLCTIGATIGSICVYVIHKTYYTIPKDPSKRMKYAPTVRIDGKLFVLWDDGVSTL